MANVIPLVEAFGPTIQGEGSVIGYQTIFLRFGGCDYKCTRCDSLHAVLPHLIKESADYLTMDELVTRTKEVVGHCEWITLSGGNPCMWDLMPLIRELSGFDQPETFDKQENSSFKKFALETQGTLWQDWIPYCTRITVSPKGPGMGEQFEPTKFDVFVKNLKSHSGFSVKIVVFDQRDLEFVVDILNMWPELKPRMFLSIGNIYPPEPEGKEVPHQQIVDHVLQTYLQIAEDVMGDPRLSSVRILPQMHTLLWGNSKGK